MCVEYMIAKFIFWMLVPCFVYLKMNEYFW